MAIEIVVFPIKDGDFPLLFVGSPEGTGGLSCTDLPELGGAMALAKAVTFTGLCQAGEDGIQQPGDRGEDHLGLNPEFPMILYHNLA